MDENNANDTQNARTEILWPQEVEEYCKEFHIPIQNLAEILRDPKVNPMIRGKGFEFHALQRLKAQLNPAQWEVTKPVMNSQATSHDVDVRIVHLSTGTELSIECKLSSKGSFTIAKDKSITAKVKCMRSRTLGVEEAKKRAPLIGVPENDLLAHKDNYLAGDFDFVLTTLANSLYATDPVTKEYIWQTTSETELELKRIIGEVIPDLKASTYDYLLISESENLTPMSGFCKCSRKACRNSDHCQFIPNFPVVKFDSNNSEPLQPWNTLHNLESLLLEKVQKKRVNSL
jgi:hypothetical protein